MGRHEAARAPVPFTVVAGTAEHVPVDDRSVDTVVSSLVLCSVDDQPLVLEELRRVLRPQGRLHYYEHVRSTNRVAGALEDTLTPLWTVVAGGCHLNRPTQDVIREAGFRIVHSDRFLFSVLPGTPAVAHVIGIAERI